MKSIPELVALLTPWEKVYQDLDKNFEGLQKVLGSGVIDSPMFDAAWRCFDLLTASLERELGDANGTLSWYAHENEMGKRKHVAGLEGRLRPIRSLKDLAWLLRTTTEGEKP